MAEQSVTFNECHSLACLLLHAGLLACFMGVESPRVCVHVAHHGPRGKLACAGVFFPRCHTRPARQHGGWRHCERERPRLTKSTRYNSNWPRQRSGRSKDAGRPACVMRVLWNSIPRNPFVPPIPPLEKHATACAANLRAYPPRKHLFIVATAVRWLVRRRHHKRC